jgi:geranylgeranyl transferase type-2 subunit beta
LIQETTSREPYLLRLTVRLAEGLARLPAETRDRHRAYLQSAQNADGGFSGREGGSDLYYTGFGLRGLAVLDALTPELCERAAGFLRGCLGQQTSVVDFFSFLYSCFLVQLAGGPNVLADSAADWPERVADVLERLRTPDGGYAKSPENVSGSTYHTFLVALCYELLGNGIPDRDGLIRFIHSRRREDGGYVEVAPMRRSGTNPTAAAVGVLQMAGDDQDLTSEIRDGVIRFLSEMPSVEGGLRANGRAPLADLLSTFTGVWTLEQLGALDRLDKESILSFVESVELTGGGFRGGLWDGQTDVEYSFYGLGCLALVS